MTEARIQKSWNIIRPIRLFEATVYHGGGDDKIITVVKPLKSINDVGSGFVEFASDKEAFLIPAGLIKHVEVK